MLVRRVAALMITGLVLAGLSATAAPPAKAVDGLSVFPRVGGIRAVFAFRFVAPYKTYAQPDRSAAYYMVEIDALPKPCHFPFPIGASNWLHVRLQPGDRASIRIDHTFVPPLTFGGDNVWCPGRYRAHLDYERLTRSSRGPTFRTRRLASNITFRVAREDSVTQPPRKRLIFFPRVGGPRETFMASFVAPYRAGFLGGNHEADYVFFASGPEPCSQVVYDGRNYSRLLPGRQGFPSLQYARPTGSRPGINQTVPGDRLLLDPEARAIQVSSGFRREWCPGRYVGRIDYIKRIREGPVIKRRTLFSNIVFRVRR